jgi:hypothetical protein
MTMTATLGRLLSAGLALVLAGIVVAVLAEGTTAVAVALGLAGAGGVLLVSAVFYAVGRSEDEERARRR